MTHSADATSIPNGGNIFKIMNMSAHRGEMHAVVSGVVTGANCSMEVRINSAAGVTTDGFVLSSGTNTYLLANASALASPGTRQITKVTFTCDATASMTLDWVSIQNSNSVWFPPSSDATVVWEDLDVTGGGRHNAVRKTESGLMLAASDGGVAMWDPLVASDEWHFVSGFGNSGIPTWQRYVSDVAGVDWDADGIHELFALSGETVDDGSGGRDTLGGLWRSDDDGASWDPVEDSFGAQNHLAPAYDDDAAHCGASSGNFDGGGQKLLADEVTEVLYVASHRDHANYGDADPPEDAVLMWDQATASLCAPLFDLPTDQTLSALAFAEGYTDGVPLLLVGYRAPNAADSGLYACDVGTAFGGPSLTCSTGGTVVCTPVAATTGWDVRDIEVDPNTGLVYVATGRASDTSCVGGTGQVWELDFDEFDLVSVDAAPVDLSINWSTDFTFGDKDATGVSIEPTGTYLYAVVPETEEGILRYEIGDSTYTWLRMGENQSERPAKRAMMDTGKGWLGGTLIVVESYVPEVRDFLGPIDLTWFTSWDEELNEEEVLEEVETTHALLLGWKGLWDIDGLDEPESGAYHPAYESEWALTPRVDNWWAARNFGTIGPADIEVDESGNVWMATGAQMGLLAYDPQPVMSGDQSGAEQHCLFERYDADGSSVSVGLDGSVWVSLVDPSGQGTPQDIGIWKRTVEEVWVEPEGLTPGFWATVPQWWYQGGGWDQEGSNDEIERVTVDTFGQYNDALCEWPREDYSSVAWNESVYDGPTATALGTHGGSSADPNGAEFVSQVLDRSGDSWGNPRVVVALDEMIAVAAFETYTNDANVEVSGQLAYTIDGGHNWTMIDTIVDYAAGPVDESCGTMSEFYDASISMVMLGRGTDSVWEDTDSDGVVDGTEWQLHLMLGSAGSSTPGCMMAEVFLNDNDAYWGWYGNTPSADAAGCRVSQEGFDGLTDAPWSNEIFFWGGYSAEYSAGATPNDYLEYGGVCALDLDTATISSVISPATSERKYEYQFADVAASPNVSDLLLVTGRQTPETVMECREPVGSGSLSTSFCPTSTPPLFVSRDASGAWAASPIAYAPWSDAGVAATWAVGASSWMYLSTEHSGAWKGSLTW